MDKFIVRKLPGNTEKSTSNSTKEEPQTNRVNMSLFSKFENSESASSSEKAEPKES